MEKLNASQSKWLNSPALKKVFDAIENAKGEVHAVGGVVRNAILNEPIGDVDLCTTLTPDKVEEALKDAGIRSIPTGIEFGTVTAVIDKASYEITSLREDIETDGRHAVVKFGTDWEKDAKRRDLTMNAIYSDREGVIFDPLNGMPDLLNRQVRFIGEAGERIEEDYLRILRFYRFFAWYGAGRPDAAGLKACAKLKEGISHLSVERVWSELKKLLQAPDPSRALLWMRTTGVLNIALVESEKWGIDLIAPLIESEEKIDKSADALLRLMSIIPPRDDVIVALAQRLKLSGLVQKRLLNWAKTPKIAHDVDDVLLRRFFYENDAQGVLDVLALDIALLESRGDFELQKTALEYWNKAQNFERPSFPISGSDLIEKGVEAGPKMGVLLKQLEAKWIESDFVLSKQDLLEDNS
ncbi:MAG: CCA tRNA nucleotidyltransferase [Nitratireductor sp.]